MFRRHWPGIALAMALILALLFAFKCVAYGQDVTVKEASWTEVKLMYNMPLVPPGHDLEPTWIAASPSQVGEDALEAMVCSDGRYATLIEYKGFYFMEMFSPVGERTSITYLDLTDERTARQIRNTWNAGCALLGVGVRTLCMKETFGLGGPGCTFLGAAAALACTNAPDAMAQAIEQYAEPEYPSYPRDTVNP